MASDLPVIVLVPGAFHRPSVWNSVAGPLRQLGYTVLTPALAVCGDLSSKGPEAEEWKNMANADALDDVKVILSELLPLFAKGREAVIVSHSYGSLPSTASVEGNTVTDRAARGLSGGFKAVVNIAGFAYPIRGLSVMGDENEPPLMPYHVLKDGIVHLQEDAKDIWYGDLDPAARDAAWSDLFKTQSRKSFLFFPQFIESQINVPKTYVLCENDQAVPPQFQEALAGIGAFDNVIRLPTGHTVQLSKPDEVVNIITNVANKK